MESALWVKARGGKEVKFLTPSKAEVYGPFGEPISKKAVVIYSGIDCSKAWKMLERKNPFLIDFETSPKGQQCIIVGPYGLRAGSCSEVNTRNIFDPASSSALDQLEDGEKITESINILKSGVDNQKVGDIVIQINFLKDIPLNKFLSAKQSSLDIISCLEKE